MFWSVIRGKGLGRLFIVDGILKQDQNKKAIETCLLPQLKEWFPNKQKKLFMQDGSPCHTAKAIKNLSASQKVPVGLARELPGFKSEFKMYGSY